MEGQRRHVASYPSSAWARISSKLCFVFKKPMTRTRYRIYETEFPYFLTCTIAGWLPVFTRKEAVEIVLDSWRHLQRQEEFRLFGYVILENHLHLIASAPRLAVAI